jgi:hypothetical protein
MYKFGDEKGQLKCSFCGKLQDQVKKFKALAVQAFSVLFQDYLRELVNGTQRITQVMGNRVAEALELTVDLFQLLLPVFRYHCPLAGFRGDIPQLFLVALAFCDVTEYRDVLHHTVAVPEHPAGNLNGKGAEILAQKRQLPAEDTVIFAEL